MITKKFSFSRAKRLKKPEDFRAVFNQPLRSRSEYFTILARPNGKDIARLGAMVAKRLIKRAVQRNTVRRVIRESFRFHQEQLKGLDVVVMARCDLSRQQNSHLNASLKQQWRDLITLWKNV